MNGWTAIGVVVMLIATIPLSAQSVEQSVRGKKSLNHAIHVHANLVYVPVTVTNSEGDLVANLRQQDFLLTDNGHPETIRMFEQPSSQPLSVVLAMDTSLSVRKDLGLEKHAARDFIHALLRTNDQMELISFAGRVKEVVPFTGNAARIDHGLNNLRGDGPTALYAAISRGAHMLETLHSRRVIILISDGSNSISGVDFEQARMAALRAEASIESVILVPISASAGRNLGGEHALIQLSRDTGGQYFYVQQHGQLPSALAQLSQALHNEYLLGFYASPAKVSNDLPQNNFRQIRVQMTNAAVNAHYHLYFRTGYTIEPEH